MKIDVKRFILILLLIISVWYIFLSGLFKPGGVRVISIGKNAECGDLKVGGIITQMGGKYVRNKQDFDRFENSVVAGKRVSMVVNGLPGSCIALGAGELDVEVGDVASKGFRFGTDLVGGEKFSLSAETELSYGDVSYISDVLEKRLKVVDLEGSKISVDDKTIVIFVPTGSEIGLVLTKGRIEAVIEEELKLSNGTGSIRVGTESYNVFFNDSIVTVDDLEYGINESFDVSGIQFKIINATNESAIVDALIFDNSGIESPTGSVGYASYSPQFKQYQFNIPVELSDSASEKFSKITEGLLPLYGAGRGVLNGMLVYYLDGEEITRLSIPADMVGVAVKTISIVGSESTMKGAINKKILVEIALEGEIEKNLVIKNIESFSGNMDWMVWVGEVVLISSVIAVFLVGLIRYKNLKIGAAGALILGLEIIYIFGVASISQAFLTSGWVLDANSLIGVCLFSVISVTQIILLLEKFLKRRVVKRYIHFLILVFFTGFIILFTPLNRMGLALIVGSLIGTFLTKPVYIDFLSGFR